MEGKDSEEKGAPPFRDNGRRGTNYVARDVIPLMSGTIVNARTQLELLPAGNYSKSGRKC